MVGMSAAALTRFALVTPSARILPVFVCGNAFMMLPNVIGK